MTLRWQRAVAFTAIVLASIVCVCISLLHVDASNPKHAREQLREGSVITRQQGAFGGPVFDVVTCEPESVPDSQRCTYVWSNPSCSPKSGLLNYLALYYCVDNPPIAGALMLGWLLLLFCTMYVASDAFFCPTLELISDHLNLSPAVAGATLLAFGNGAPDLMSIIASMHSGTKGGGPVAPASVSMALSEPLGTGLFVGNIVLGATVLMSRASREVTICPYHFFKDITFYLTALGTVLYCLMVGEVHLWQGVFILVLYMAYMSVSIFMPREVEKEAIIHPELLTLVPHGPWDDIPSEDVEGASWEDVVSKAMGGSSTADSDVWSPPAGAAGLGSYLQWGKDRLWGGKHKGALLQARTSGELLRAWSTEQQQWVEPEWHRLCDSDELYGEDDGLGRLGRLPRSQKRRANMHTRSRRWSYGDVVGAFMGSRGRSPDGGAEQGRGAWGRADEEQRQQRLLRQPLINREYLGNHGDVQQQQQQQQQGQGEEHPSALLPATNFPSGSEGWGFGSWCSPPQGPSSPSFAAAHSQQQQGRANPALCPSPIIVMGEGGMEAGRYASAPWSPLVRHSSSDMGGSSEGAEGEGRRTEEGGSGSNRAAGESALALDGGAGALSTQPDVSALLSAEPLAHRNVHFKRNGDSWSTGAVPNMGGPCSKEQMGADQTPYQQQQQTCLSPGVSGAWPPSRLERFDAHCSVAGQIQEPTPSPPLQPPQQRSALPPHSPHVPSQAGVHTHVHTQAPPGPCSLSPVNRGWGDGKRGIASRRRSRSTAVLGGERQGCGGVLGVDSRLSPGRASSKPGGSEAGIGTISRSRRRSHTAHRKTGASPDMSQASSRGTSEPDFDNAGHWVADEPVLSQGDLEAAIPLLLEQRYDELHFLLRHAVPSTSLHPHTEHASSVTTPHASLAEIVSRPQPPHSRSVRASTEAPHAYLAEPASRPKAPHIYSARASTGTPRYDSQGTSQPLAHPPAGACVGAQKAHDAGRHADGDTMGGDLGGIGHDADDNGVERRPVSSRVRAVSTSGGVAGSAAAAETDVRAVSGVAPMISASRRASGSTAAEMGVTGSTAATDADMRAHLENEHLRLKKLIFFLQRQRQCRSFAACGFPDIEAPASPETLVRQHFRRRRRRTSAAEAHTCVPRLSADLSRHHLLQPGGYLSGGSGDGSVGSARGWANETCAAASPPPVMLAALQPSAASEPQPSGVHIPSQPQLSARELPCSTHGLHHPQLPPSLSNQCQKHHPQQQQQRQRQQQQQEGSVNHQRQPYDHHHHHHHLHYQQDGRVHHQHQPSHLQPHQLQHRHHQHVYPHRHGHKRQSGQHMLDSQFVDGVESEAEIEDANRGSGAEKEVKEWDEDWRAAEEVMDGVVDEITLEWAEVLQGTVRWYFKSHTRLLRIIWRAMQRVIIALLSLTMPRIDRSDVPYSPFTAAVLMPVIGPCTVAIYMKWWDPFFSALKDIRGGSGDLLSAYPGTPSVAEPVQGLSPSPVHPLPSPSLVSLLTEASKQAMIAASAKKQLLLLFGTSACVWLWVVAKWPRDGRLRGNVLGVAVVLTFVGAMAWMDAAANELVGLVLVAGQLVRIPVALLSATVLAWGNCMGDTVCNLTMARDGYPTMAITACFASPMFILLAGSAFVAIFGTHAAGNGVMAMPSDLPTRALYITSFTNMTMWALLTPLLFKFRLDYRTAVIGFLFYAGFQAMFVTLVIGSK